jgi:hypothetical protein
MREWRISRMNERANTYRLLPSIQRTLVLPLKPIANDNAIGDYVCSVVLASSFLSAGVVADFGYGFPFFVCDRGEVAFEVCDLLLHFWTFGTVLGEFVLFVGFSGRLVSRHIGSRWGPRAKAKRSLSLAE